MRCWILPQILAAIWCASIDLTAKCADFTGVHFEDVAMPRLCHSGVHTMKFSGDGKLLYSHGASIRIWSEAGQLLGIVEAEAATKGAVVGQFDSDDKRKVAFTCEGSPAAETLDFTQPSSRIGCVRATHWPTGKVLWRLSLSDDDSPTRHQVAEGILLGEDQTSVLLLVHTAGPLVDVDEWRLEIRDAATGRKLKAFAPKTGIRNMRLVGWSGGRIILRGETSHGNLTHNVPAICSLLDSDGAEEWTFDVGADINGRPRLMDVIGSTDWPGIPPGPALRITELVSEGGNHRYVHSLVSLAAESGVVTKRMRWPEDIYPLSTEDLTGSVVSPKAQRVMIIDNSLEEVCIADWKTGKAIQVAVLNELTRLFTKDQIDWRTWPFKSPQFCGAYRISCVAWTADCSRMACAVEGDPTLYVIDLSTGSIARGDNDSAECCSAATNSAKVAIGSGNSVSIFASAPPYRLVRTIQGSGRILTAVGLSEDGDLVAAGGWDRALHIWDVRSGMPSCSATELPAPLAAVRFRPRSRFLVSVDEIGTVVTWQIDGQCVQRSLSAVARVAPPDWLRKPSLPMEGEAAAIVRFANRDEDQRPAFEISSDGTRVLCLLIGPALSKLTSVEPVLTAASMCDDGAEPCTLFELNIQNGIQPAWRRLEVEVPPRSPLRRARFESDGSGLILLFENGTVMTRKNDSLQVFRAGEAKLEECVDVVRVSKSQLAIAQRRGRLSIVDAGSMQIQSRARVADTEIVSLEAEGTAEQPTCIVLTRDRGPVRMHLPGPSENSPTD